MLQVRLNHLSRFKRLVFYEKDYLLSAPQDASHRMQMGGHQWNPMGWHLPLSSRCQIKARKLKRRQLLHRARSTLAFMEDIIMHIPSYCDDCETWHQEFIWAYDDGTYSICDSDGDHEPLDAEEVPSQEEHNRLWQQYSHWVVEHGEDPLGNFMVRHVAKVKERWQFKLIKTLVGPRLIEARRSGHAYAQADLPEHVRSFLNLDSSGKLCDFSTWDELIEVLPDIKPSRWFISHIEYDKPRPETVISSELRKAALRHS